MKTEDIAKLLAEKFPDKVSGQNLEVFDPYVFVAPDAIAEVALFCRDEPSLKLDYLKNMSGVDYLIPDEKKAKKIGIEPHLEVVYHLFSFEHQHDFVLKVSLDRWGPEGEGDLPTLPTVSNVWRVADWHEREIYDLVGILFIGHPNLRRILCAEDWEGHPLRKDYVFPTEYHGIRCQ